MSYERKTWDVFTVLSKHGDEEWKVEGVFSGADYPNPCKEAKRFATAIVFSDTSASVSIRYNRVKKGENK